MKSILATTILTGAMLAGGCATKKYVRNTTAPIQAKVDQVGEQTTKQGQVLEQTRNDVKQVDEKAQGGISAAKEAAMTAQNSAADAMSKASQVGQTAEQAKEANQQTNRDLASLRQTVSNLDDYKLQSAVTIPFRFNKWTLTKDDKGRLDQAVNDLGKVKRYFIAVEGFTDRTGSIQYNEQLSQRRANAVTEYLVANHDVPIFRIHQIGLGEAKLVAEGRTRAARAKNRRVEVKIFSADQMTPTVSQLQQK